MDDLRSEEEIEAQLDKTSDLINETNGKSKWPGMTYERGVQAALEWVLCHADEPPIEED